MANSAHAFDLYRFKAFLDTNIILEGRPLPELPWHEIDADGPIIVLITPTVIREVDGHKQDGRVGERARAFNRLIAPLATGGPPITIREANPRVVLALARAHRIPWKEYSDLDPADGDSSIVAEVLNARDMNADGKLLVSHDLKPIIFATSHGVEALHVSDKWLRPLEPHPRERENQRLKSQLAQHESGQPKFEIAINLPAGELIRLRRIGDVSATERRALVEKILTLNPKYSQFTRGFMTVFDRIDDSYDERFEEYCALVSDYVVNYEEKIERLLNQTPLEISVANVGKVQAENLLIEVRVLGGWIHDRYVLTSPRGPSAPKPRANDFFVPRILGSLPPPLKRVARHEFYFQTAPSRSERFSACCEDFRHGQNWIFDGVLGLNARSSEPSISISVTASNYRGTAVEVRKIDTSLEVVALEDIVALDCLRMNVEAPVTQFLRRGNSKDLVDWSEVENDEGDWDEQDAMDAGVV